MLIETRAIDAISVGKRFRHELGDITSLMASIRAVGLLHPIVIAKGGTLVAGARRLEACRRLGWSEIVVTVRPENDPVCRLAEADENEVRLNLCPTEQVAIARFYAEQDRQEARCRREETQGKPSKSNQAETGAKFAPVREKSKARQKTARRAGTSHTRLKQAEEVVAAAEADPKTYGPIAAKMDATGNVNAAYKEVKKRQRAEKKAAIPDNLPAVTDRYRLYVGDITEAGAQIADESLDCIITDPPYPEEFLPCWDKLGEFAARTLKPGGSLLTLAPHQHLPEILPRLTVHLDYHWLLAYVQPGATVKVWGNQVIVGWKPILWFTKGKLDRKDEMHYDVVQSGGRDKEHHEWGQSAQGMATLVERFTDPGETVGDPFVGGGATAVATVGLSRRFVGIDIDAVCVKATKERLAGLS